MRAAYGRSQDHTFECDTCTRRFNTWKACKQHTRDTNHCIWPHECDTCSLRFKSKYYAEKHMEKEDHYSYPFDCETCDYAFRSAHARDEHQVEEGHYTHLHCQSCDRYFQSENNLSQHMKSRIHQGSNIPCPFCKTGFVTASGVSHHLETGSCPKAPSLDRASIYRELRKRDPTGAITERLLEYPGSSSLSQHWDPISAWNGYCYECYICHREFSSSNGLRQHITSPIHESKLYHCPNIRGQCVKKFPSLAALFNHLESESCGYIRFGAVGKNVNSFLSGRGAIAF